MMGAVESIGAISPGFGFALGGVIAAAGSPRTALLIAGVGATTCTIAFVRLPLGGLTSTAAVPAARTSSRSGRLHSPTRAIRARPARRSHLKDHAESAVKYDNTANRHD